MTWQQMIGRCFGLEDRHFAGHPSDENTAFELLTELRTRHIGWQMFEAELRSQLANMPKLHTEDEVARVKTFFRVWMLD